MKVLGFFLLLAGGLLSAELVRANPAAQDEAGRWTINMRDADIRDFTEQVASISGQTLVVDPRVKGQVTVISQEPLTLSEVYQLFLSVMSTHGYAVITQGDQARVVPDAEARSVASNAGTGPDTLETRLLQVQQTPVAELLPLIRPLVPAHGHLAAIPSSNALIVSDKRANIERLIELIAQADRASSDDSSFYDLRHAWANDVAAALLESLRRGQAQGTSNSQVIADTRTNRLLLLGTPEARQRLLKLAQRLDVPSVRSANTRVIRLRHGDAKAMAQTLGELSEQLRPQAKNGGGQPPVLIRADEGLNALVLLAEPDIVSQLEDIVRQLDVPRAQVLVEAAIVEMSGDVSEALGVQWAIDGRNGKSSIGGVNFSNTGLSVGTLLGAISSDTPISLPDGAIIGVGNDNFGALVTALSANSSSNLLSTPSLLTLDNQKAEILVGQNVPFQTGSYTTDAAGANNPFTTIEREDIGVTLKVTPHINEGGALRLDIEQEISSIAPSTGLASKAVDLVTNKRSIKSTVLADNGQVIVLGGLMQDDVTRSESKVPLLGDIPLLGRMFRSTKDVNVKRNLMVFLRPSVVRDGAGLANLSQQKYQDIRVFGDDNGAPQLLPADPQRLFQRRTPDTATLDLREPVKRSAQPQAQPPAAPLQTLIERPRPVDPATLSDGRGGDQLPTQVVVVPAVSASEPQRFSIALIEGSSEAYMRTLIAQHPKEPLHLRQEQRHGQEWYRMFYGDYPRAELAERALRDLPSSLPSHRGKVVAL
ncbi:MAG: type II secretion system secretin GspD [Gammaproteobacteria bacterium]